MSKSIFYHAGCPICVNAEQDIVNLIGASNVDIIHLGEKQSLINNAKNAGVQSVPAVVTPNGNVLHINFGAYISDIKK
ncbi:thioredoxin family protein [uncultured Aquimarina sp.]|uniref:thioredoxin family protein n=1 Tax=uncultured Aquimarina sp. TaxID=575652 RepID=UPI0026025D36|nr:thioredoxin family protein [uncultured Aquimarina sp.]